MPKLCEQLYERALEGDSVASDAYQVQLNQISNLIRGNHSLVQPPGVLKAAMSTFSLCGPLRAATALDMDGTEQARVGRAFKEWLGEPERADEASMNY